MIHGMMNVLMYKTLGIAGPLLLIGLQYYAYSCMIPTCAYVYCLCSLFMTILFNELSAWMAVLIFIMANIILPYVGHFKIEGFRPAFRIFEALVSTPVFCMLYMLQ